jgi:hypothetical protein
MSLAARIFQRIKSYLPYQRFSPPDPSNIKRLSESNGRFYPSHIEEHPNEPTPDKFTIVYHPDFGEGVKTKVFFNKGELVFRFDGHLLHHQTLYTLQKNIREFIEDPYFTGKILHSCDPNTTVDMEQQIFWASKDIHPGHYLTMDYESTEDLLFNSFDCQCGSDKCRGFITGKRSNKSN